MMQYINAVIYIVVGLIGAFFHYYKKRHKDNTTNCTFLEYIRGDYKSTLLALGAIFASQITLSFTGGEDFPSFHELWLAGLSGYGFDSLLNKAPDAKQVEVR